MHADQSLTVVAPRVSRHAYVAPLSAEKLQNGDTSSEGVDGEVPIVVDGPVESSTYVTELDEQPDVAPVVLVAVA